ncbi:MAG: MATE family efflux transporter [Tepidibacter sp.]|jgi:putative MATE family efflux protein|uniref:MATE family efflux transporter n=1 Tax=Tepidibacter sp. TaxID=2529387 RepID=UPI0025D9EAB5|nr:MATE family efflux transporter [Tepidibacter sp.]MCT4507878.1 MATE family efflux transporter [Tepidibacter sp.]
MNNRIKLISEGNVTKSLFKLGIPMVVSMLVIALYNVVDTYFVSSLGTSQVAAVSVAFPISLIFSGIGLTFGTGGGSYISRLLGSKEYKKANQVASTALFSSLIIGILLVLAILVFLNPVLKFMGATQTILPYARSYAVIFVISMLFSTVNVTTGNIVISQGASNITLTAMIVGSVLNMILDPICIFLLDMGIQGAAIATLISQIITSGIYTRFFYSDKNYIKIKLSNFSPNKKTYIEIIKIGISMLLLQVLSSLSMSLISKSASTYGDEAVAAIGIVLRIVTLGTNVVFGFMKGFQPMAGFNYGAKNYERLKEATISSMKLTTAFCIIWTIISFAFANPVVSLFSTDQNVIQIADRALKANTIMFFTFGFQFTYSTLYLSLGKALSGGILSICRQGIFFIPVILILSSKFGLNGILYSQALADLLTTIVTAFFAMKIKLPQNVNN